MSELKEELILRPVVVSGPSGAGKSTLINMLKDEFPGMFSLSVSHTTRSPRPGEQDGVHYHYVTREEMAKKIENGDFIETAEFSGNLYGTSKQAIKDVAAKNQICLLDIDMQGCESMRKTDLNALFLQIQPASLDVLHERLVGRGTETDLTLNMRMTEARQSLDYGRQAGNFDCVIVNDDKVRAYGELKSCLSELIEVATKLRALNNSERAEK